MSLNSLFGFFGFLVSIGRLFNAFGGLFNVISGIFRIFSTLGTILNTILSPIIYFSLNSWTGRIFFYIMPPKNRKRKVENEVPTSAKISKGAEKTQSGTGKKTESSGSSAVSSNGKLSVLLTQPDWVAALSPEFSKYYFQNIETQIQSDKKDGIQVFPEEKLIFNCLNRTALKDVKVVLLGQDPYHDVGQAMGLCFAVPEGIKVPPSLKNMYTELSTDIPGFKVPGHGNLEKWADQGVLLLNTTLTVQAHKPNSHSKIGWMTFTDQIIRTVSEINQGVVFMLWGNFSQKKEKLIDTTKHTVLKDAHPSPLSVTKYRGCKCFSRANVALKKAGKAEIDWKL